MEHPVDLAIPREIYMYMYNEHKSTLINIYKAIAVFIFFYHKYAHLNRRHACLKIWMLGGVSSTEVQAQTDLWKNNAGFSTAQYWHHICTTWCTFKVDSSYLFKQIRSYARARWRLQAPGACPHAEASNTFSSSKSNWDVEVHTSYYPHIIFMFCTLIIFWDPNIGSGGRELTPSGARPSSWKLLPFPVVRRLLEAIQIFLSIMLAAAACYHLQRAA